MIPKKSPDAADESRALKARGDAHLSRDEWDDAERCYRAAVAIDPDFVDACIALGFVLTTQRRYSDAERFLGHALSIDPNIADTHYLLARIRNECGDRAGAIPHLERVVELKHDSLDAHRDLFLALFEGGRTIDAETVITRAISLFPESAEFHFYLGHLLDRLERYDQAIDRYQRSLSLQPESAQTHNNLGDVFRKCGQPDRAVACYRKAIAVDPAHVDALANLGGVLHGQGRVDEAIAFYRQVLALNPGYAAVLHRLGNALLEKGNTGDALACYEQVVKLDPDGGVAHLIAALSGSRSDRAPSRYVENLFDDYAEKFDSHLMQSLRYETPGKLVALLREASGMDAGRWKVLDLGCGTGLSGLAIARWSRELVGVDLSGRMLAKARAKGVYQRLERQDLLAMMQGETTADYDVVLAADVLVYLGRLDDLVLQARRLLRPDGFFAFSVESLEAWPESEQPTAGNEFRLASTGRYAHSMTYLDRMASEHRFEVMTAVDTPCRLEKGKPVDAHLGVWRRLRE